MTDSMEIPMAELGFLTTASSNNVDATDTTIDTRNGNVEPKLEVDLSLNYDSQDQSSNGKFGVFNHGESEESVQATAVTNDNQK